MSLGPSLSTCTIPLPDRGFPRPLDKCGADCWNLGLDLATVSIIYPIRSLFMGTQGLFVSFFNASQGFTEWFNTPFLPDCANSQQWMLHTRHRLEFLFALSPLLSCGFSPVVFMSTCDFLLQVPFPQFRQFIVNCSCQDKQLFTSLLPVNSMIYLKAYAT